MKDLQPHPLAEILPRMTDAEFASLKADISATGFLREPIVLLDGLILDGRHRYQACNELGIKPAFVKYVSAWGDPLSYVISKANHRHLTESQKACVAATAIVTFEEQAKSRQGKKGQSGGDARDIAGRLFGVSGRYVSDAKALLVADAKLFQQAFNGGLKLSQAKLQLARRKRQQKAQAVARSRRIITPDDAQIIRGDSLLDLGTLPRRHFRCVFADPPYNLGFAYDADPTKDALPPSNYLALTRTVIDQCAELLTPDGSLWWMVPEEWVSEVKPILIDAGLHVRRLIVWHESFGQSGKQNFGRTCRYIWYAVKDHARFVFDPGAILVESKRSAVYGDRRAQPGGKVPDALWDFSRVCGTFAERIPDEGIPTQLPVELVKRVIACCTDPGDEVLDPFGGTGTTARAALALGRKVTLIERSKRYCQIIRRELLAAGKGNG